METNSKGWYPRMNSKSKRSESPSTPTLSPKINNLMQCKLVPIRSSMISKQLQLYKFRYNTSYPIFQIHHFSCDPSPPEIILPADTVLAKIVYELPQKRLSDLQRPVSIENSLYILKTVLMGCEKLVQFFGWFQIKENMIGFGKDGDCKVWVNEMLEVNEVMIPANCEEDMVESVKKIFIGLLGHDQTQNCLIQLLSQQRHTIIELTKAIWSFSYDFSILIPPQFQNSPKAIHRKTKSQVPSLIKRKSIEMSTNVFVKINETNRKASRYKQAVTARNSKQRGKSRSCSKRSQINNKDFSILSNIIKQNSSISFHNKQSTSSSMVKSDKYSKFNLRSQQYSGNDNTIINIAVHSPVDQSQNSSRSSQTSQFSWSETDEKNYSDYQGVIVGERKIINFREGSAMVKMNKSSHVETIGVCTSRKPQKKLNSKSDFICLSVEREQSIKKSGKQNILKDEDQCHKVQVTNARSFFKNLNMNQGFVVVESQHCATPSELSQNPSSVSSMIQTDSILTQNPSQQNKKKMKNMIKQKIKQNRDKKKVVKLQAIQTVKSIGQFTQSQRKILSENSQNETNWNQNLQILQQMCKKIGNSYFHIDMPHVESEQEMEQETADEKGKIYQNQCYADNSDQISGSR